MSAIERVASFVAARVDIYQQSNNTIATVCWSSSGNTMDLTVADLESLLADARRYQKLRSLWFDFGVMRNIHTPLGSAIHRIAIAGDLETLDAAIDAAMERTK